MSLLLPLAVAAASLSFGLSPHPSPSLLPPPPQPSLLLSSFLHGLAKLKDALHRCLPTPQPQQQEAATDPHPLVALASLPLRLLSAAKDLLASALARPIPALATAAASS